MRNTSFAQPVSDAVISSLQLLTREAVEREGKPLRFAKIGVLSQRERHALNASQARAFARHTPRMAARRTRPPTKRTRESVGC